MNWPQDMTASAKVAPRAGAWIETCPLQSFRQLHASPPARGRGLKRKTREDKEGVLWSPPARGRGLKRSTGSAWTGPLVSPPARGRGLKHQSLDTVKWYVQSPPARGRGLKLRHLSILCMTVESPPARGRGLKHFSTNFSFITLVAPRAGAWIETCSGYSDRRRGLVAPRAGAWIETAWTKATTVPPFWVAPRAGAWIETDDQAFHWWGNGVAPRAGAWIETYYCPHFDAGLLSPPARGRGLKHSGSAARDCGIGVAPRASISCFFLLIKVIGTQLSIILDLIYIFNMAVKTYQCASILS